MNFFWKIFFTTMFTSMTFLALGGYMLIHSNFHSLLDNEVATAYDYGDIVYYSISREIRNSWPQGYILSEAEVEEFAQLINISNMSQRIQFGMIDGKGETIFSSLDVSLDKKMMPALGASGAGWTLKSQGEHIYIQAMRPIELRQEQFYIEIVRDVTFIFDNQTAQYETLLKIMAGMLAIGGMITFIISKLLMRRVSALTKVTKRIAAGNLEKRMEVRGEDEISELSRNFNKMADDLEEKIRRLEEQAEREELFVGAFSHELKTPLTSVIGYADMLRRKEMGAEQTHICAEYIFSEGKRLETLSIRLLELIVLRKQEIHRKPVDITEFFADVCFIAQLQLEQSDIAFSCHMERAVIAMEPELMQTVFINLIDNARKAIEGRGRIDVWGERRREAYAVMIRDTGKGMDEKELPKIREAFYMVDKSRSRKQGGAGLGLAICQEVLQLHGFRIDFESAVGEGTTVTIYMEEEP